jgi:lysophospholipase L1-like esterase
MRAAALALSLIALGTPALADSQPTGGARPQHLLPVHIGGRVTPFDPIVGYQHQWPGVYFEAQFKGARVTLNFNDAINISAIYIDGKHVQTESKPGVGFVELDVKPSAEHTIRVETLTEAQQSASGFVGFSVPDRKMVLPAPAPRARQIEFIGDSYTVGYGNMSGKKQCTPDELHDTTDTSQAYGPLTAKAFNADYQINAFSGRGIVRNYDGFAGDPLPVLYPYVLFDKATEYQDDSWKPQVIVIGLGGNDFSTPVKPGEKWKDDAALKADYEASFVAFVKTLRARNPQAFFLLTKYEGPTVAEEVEKVAALLKADGETLLDTIGLDGFTLNGCDWHLDSNDHKRISEQLTVYFNAHAELWQGK